MGLEFPGISPVAFSVLGFGVRWYSLAYLFGIIGGWRLALRNIDKYKLGFSRKDIEELAFYIILGVILGGRLGYVLFYGGGAFWRNPLAVLQIWNGGMSFHGGIAGVILAMWGYGRKFKHGFFETADLVALYAPIGIFLGRLANFVNDELWGRVADPAEVPWAVRFPNGGYLPRHPSQLYEAFCEGIVLFIVLNLLWRKAWVRERAGFASALFAVFYSVFRMGLEQFREPDAQLGFFFGSITMGQMLSLPLLVAGAAVIVRLSTRRSA